MILFNHHKKTIESGLKHVSKLYHRTNYLSLNLDFSIPANHIASVIIEFVDSIPNEVILETTSNTGRPAYHPAMMLNILLFAYSRRVFSGRKIERMLEENLPMMILADNRKISYHTINNFRSSDHADKVIKQCFVYFTSLLEDKGLIRENQFLSMVLRLKRTPTGTLLSGEKLLRSIMPS